MIKVELDNIDAERFKIFQRHYETLKRIIDSGVLDLKGACAEICFNMDGVVTAIRGEIYKRKSDK